MRAKLRSWTSSHWATVLLTTAIEWWRSRFLEGSQSNVRLIRLSPGQALPAHTHDSSDLMLFAVEGEGVLHTDVGRVGFGAGSLAFYRGDEELRVSNEGQSGLTLLAFLAPPFPPSDT